MYQSIVKPISDFLLALLAMIIVSPIFIFIMMALTLYHKGTPFFMQHRPGKNERIFTIIKFKTMSDAKDSSGVLLPDKDRLTGIGKWVRTTSLDELPQLLNIITGSMSLVGPRPLLPEYLLLYSEEQKKRHLVKPGITGWAQVNGRNAISWEEKLKLDVWYVDHLSIMLDMKIVLKTIVKVFKREGIQATNEATSSRFKGNTE